jgi:hypothetical protein
LATSFRHLAKDRAKKNPPGFAPIRSKGSDGKSDEQFGNMIDAKIARLSNDDLKKIMTEPPLP